MNRALTLRQLRRILRGFGVTEDTSRGKGSHSLFSRSVGGRVVSFTVPTNCDPIPVSYMGPLRRRLALTPTDGVSDDDFYANA